MSVPNLTLRQLEVLVTIVDRGSFAAAADHFGIAQPSVSAHVRAIERHTGGPVFERTRGRRATLTALGRSVVAHAGSVEGMRRAILAGVVSIEHGDEGTPEIFKLMAEKGVALCPTLAAGDAILQYRGWKKGIDPDPDRIVQKRKTFAQALAAGVTIVAGGDVGVFTHGDNARELEMMEDYGMKPLDVLKSATSINAKVFGLQDQLGAIRPGLLADILVVDGRPDQNIQDLRKIRLVMKQGEPVFENRSLEK